MFDEQIAWKGKKLGKISASEIWKLMKKGKGKDEYFGQVALTYIDEKVTEIITGQPVKDLSNMNAIEWGHAHENEAVIEYEYRTGNKIEYYGGANPKFFPYNHFSGGSPDGLDDNSVYEVKCPYNSVHHTKNLLASLKDMGGEWLKKHHEDYYCQIQFNMMCTKRSNGIFISYDPMPINPSHRLAVIQISKDEELCNELNERINKAVELISENVSLLTSSI